MTEKQEKQEYFKEVLDSLEKELYDAILSNSKALVKVTEDLDTSTPHIKEALDNLNDISTNLKSISFKIKQIREPLIYGNFET